MWQKCVALIVLVECVFHYCGVVETRTTKGWWHIACLLYHNAMCLFTYKFAIYLH